MAPVPRKQNVTFMSDLRANGWRYAATALTLVLYLAMIELGVESWLAILIAVLVSGLIRFMVRRRHN